MNNEISDNIYNYFCQVIRSCILLKIDILKKMNNFVLKTNEDTNSLNNINCSTKYNLLFGIVHKNTNKRTLIKLFFPTILITNFHYKFEKRILPTYSIKQYFKSVSINSG